MLTLGAQRNRKTHDFSKVRVSPALPSFLTNFVHISLKGDLNIYDINNSKVLKFYCLRMPLSNVAKNISATFIANQTIDYRSVSALYCL